MVLALAAGCHGAPSGRRSRLPGPDLMHADAGADLAPKEVNNLDPMDPLPACLSPEGLDEQSLSRLDPITPG